MTTRIAAVVLAAGLGRRFVGRIENTKAVAPLQDVPIVRMVVMTALAARAAAVTVVTGHASRDIEAALHDLNVGIVYNPDFASGMASSLKAGVSAIPPNCDGALILLADMPRVKVKTLDRLITKFERSPKIDAVLPVYNGRRGNPVLLGSSLFASVLQLEGDEGARRLLASSEVAAALCEVNDPGILIDIDTPEDLRRIACSGK